MLVSSPLKSNEIELNSKDENKLTVQQHSCSDWHIKRMYGFSPVWLSSFGLSPVCVIKWLRKRLDWDDA